MDKANQRPLLMTEGKVLLDGKEVMNAVKCTIKFKPKTWTGKSLGDRTGSTRWTGVDAITVEMTQRRSTPWLKQIVAEYLKTGKTPEFTIQGTMNDADSDYYDAYGVDTTTAIGCVLTSEINLTDLDTAGETVEDSITFNAKDLA